MLGILLYINWGERRVRRLCYLAAWLFVAISFMGKGPLGGLPVICAFAYIGVKKKWIELTRVELMSGSAHRRRRGSAVVGRDVRAPRRSVHRPVDLPRHVQPRLPPRARHERRRRHEHPLLHLAARLRALSLDGARAARAGVLGAPQRLGRSRSVRRVDLSPHVVPHHLRAGELHGDQVPPLHLPRGGAGGAAHRHRPRRRPRATRSCSGRTASSPIRSVLARARRSSSPASPAPCPARSSEPRDRTARWPIASKSAGSAARHRRRRAGGGDGASLPRSPRGRAGDRRGWSGRGRARRVAARGSPPGARALDDRRRQRRRRPGVDPGRARSGDPAGGRRSAGGDPPPAALHVQLPPRLAGVARLLRHPHRVHRGGGGALVRVSPSSPSAGTSSPPSSPWPSSGASGGSTCTW